MVSDGHRNARPDTGRFTFGGGTKLGYFINANKRAFGINANKRAFGRAAICRGADAARLFIVAFRAPLEPFFYAASLSSMGTLPVPAHVGQSLSTNFSGPMPSLLPWRLPVPRQSGQGAYLAFMAIHPSYTSEEDFTVAGSRTTKSGEEKIIGAKPAT